MFASFSCTTAAEAEFVSGLLDNGSDEAVTAFVDFSEVGCFGLDGVVDVVLDVSRRKRC